MPYPRSRNVKYERQRREHELNRQVVFSRDLYRCIICGTKATNAHHCLPLGMGGTRREVTPADYISLCGSGTTGCHQKVEGPWRIDGRSYANGWLIPHAGDRTRDELAVLDRIVWYPQEGGWRRLTRDGDWADAILVENEAQHAAWGVVWKSLGHCGGDERKRCPGGCPCSECGCGGA